MDGIEVVVAHAERATLRVGDAFLKIDADPARLDREIEAMGLVPVRTPKVLWRQSSVVALGTMPGEPLGRLVDGASASPGAWRAAGAAIRTLHDAPLPPWPGRSTDDIAARLPAECEWLVGRDVLPVEVVEANRTLAVRVLRPWTPAFIHGDLQVDHVFLDGDAVGIIDWSEAAPGDPLWDLATLTLGHPGRLDDVLAGYGAEVDRDLVRGWWSMRCLLNIRWLAEHGFGDPADFPETAVLRAQAGP